MVIKVNGEPHETTATMLHYEDVVALAGMTGTPSMTWSMRTANERTGGILHAGDSVFVNDGMTFNVAHTGNA